MSRVLNVVRLQLINRQTFVWIPLIILASATVMSIAIYALIPVDAPKYGGGGQAPLWYFFAIGLSAMTMSFPFSQAMSITRRDFFAGTMITAALSSLAMAVVFVIGGWIEGITGGWGVNGYVFRLPGVWDSGPLGAGLVYFTLALLFFVIGFTGATVHKRWGPLATTVFGVGLGAALLGAAVLITRLELWGAVIRVVGAWGFPGAALWVLGFSAVLAAVSFLLLRRATP